MSTLLVDEQIRMLSKQLKIPTFSNYNEVIRQAKPDSSISELLLLLMKSEYEQRQENQNLRRLKQAGFPYTKTLDELDLSQYNGEISNVFVNELASCKFIKDCRNITMLGNPGRGKTHMAIGLGLKACSQGMTVLFKNAASLSTELSEASDRAGNKKGTDPSNRVNQYLFRLFPTRGLCFIYFRTFSFLLDSFLCSQASQV